MAGLSGVTTTAGLLATVTGINAKTAATTTLYTVPAGKTCVVTKLVIRCTAFTVGSKTQNGTAYFGTAPAGFDWSPVTPVMDLDAVGEMTVIDASLFATSTTAPPKQVTFAAAAGFDMTIETPSNATTETWAVDLFGYLV